MSLSWHRIALAMVGAVTSLQLSNAHAELQGRDLDGDSSNGFEAYYDTQQDISWLADANYFKTQLSAQSTAGDQVALIQRIIDQVGVIDNHPLTMMDFNATSGSMSWWGAMAWAQSLTVQGIQGWRLPKIMRPDCMVSYELCSAESDVSELGHLYYTTLGNTDLTEDPAFPDGVQLFPNRGGFTHIAASYEIVHFTIMGMDSAFVVSDRYALQGADSYGTFQSAVGLHFQAPQDSPMYGWAVRTGDVSAVPEVGTQMLMTLGLTMIGGAMRRRQAVKR